MKQKSLILVKGLAFMLTFISLTSCEEEAEKTPLNENAPIAAFEASATNVEGSGTVNFTDLSTKAPTSWNWVFAGGTPAISTEQNPIVTYSVAGTYAVTLIATNADGSDTLTKNAYITVTASTTPAGGVFTYKVDGVAHNGGWLIGTLALHPPGKAYYSTSNKTLVIQSISQACQINLNCYNITSTGAYSLGYILTGTSQAGNWASIVILPDGFNTDADNTGTVTISKFDLTNNKMSGTFSFKAHQISTDGKPVGTVVKTVTEGKFTDIDITYN